MPNQKYLLSGRIYAFLIAFVSAVGGFLFGYDLAIIGTANVYLKEQFQLSDFEFGFATASATLGCIIGPLFGGWFCDRYGRRNTLIGACVLLAIGSLLTAIPNDMITFNIFRIVGGIGVGFCSIASPMYTNEIAPARWRGGLGFMYQLAIVVGSVIAALVGLVLAQGATPEASEFGRQLAQWVHGDAWLNVETAWRWMFASELVFVAIFGILLFFLPESPRWLAERGRRDEAEAVFVRIDGPEFARAEMAQIEQSLEAESGSLSELWSPGLRMALFVGLCLALFNNYTGWTGMGGYLTKLYESAQLTREEALRCNFWSWAFMGAATLLACGLVDRLGRRPLWLVASVMMIGTNAFMGWVFYENRTGLIVLVPVFLCAIPHSFALGPLPWLMMSEIFPTRIRARAVAITTTFIWAVGFVAVSLFPVLCELSKSMMGSTAGAFWLSAIVCVFSFLFGLTMLPETRGRTLEEIAESWRKK